MNQLKMIRLIGKLKYLLCIGLMLAQGARLNAQQTNVKGKVSDNGGQALAGVSVQVKGTSVATMTNAQGLFSLNIGQANATLKFSYVGYQTQELALNGKTDIQVTMVAESTALDEIVVIGYGAVAKSDLTGSVASVKSEDLTKGANVNMQQALQGRTPGVQI